MTSVGDSCEMGPHSRRRRLPLLSEISGFSHRRQGPYVPGPTSAVDGNDVSVTPTTSTRTRLGSTRLAPAVVAIDGTCVALATTPGAKRRGDGGPPFVVGRRPDFG